MENVGEKIKQIRIKFEEELLGESPQFHPIDIERVRCEDWQIARYIINCNGDIDEAFRSLKRTLVWKNEIGLHRIDENYFPTEFYELYKVEKYGTDKCGRMIFTESFAKQRHYNELEQCFQLMVAVSMEKMDRLAGERGMTYVGDFTNTPIYRMDIGLARYRVDCLNNHFPLLAKKIILNNVPFVLKPILRLIVSFMAKNVENIVQYTTSDQLQTLIDWKYIPFEFGGPRNKRYYPLGTVPFHVCYTRFSVKPSFVQYFYRSNNLTLN
ncbi:hypothetical protein BLOT_016591 [Blomia tropicalis]|nr:hypothetical protein BLOT_016591 [Blomia tropicalis]